MKPFPINTRSSPFFVSMLMLGLLTLTDSCKKGNDPPSQREINQAALAAATWTITSVTVDGTDRTSLFTGMTLQFQASSYTATNGAPVWPNSGTWTFTDDTAMALKRNDDVVVTITTINIDNLVLALTWGKTTLGSGRVGSVAGQHVFSFGK